MAPSAAAATAHSPLLSASTPTTTSTSASSSSTTTSATTTQTTPKPRQWNTKNLGMRLGADAVSAGCAAGLISPLIAFIDKSIMENASGSSPSILTSLRASFASLVRHPLRTLATKPVGLVFLLYGGTYLTANTLDTASSTLAPAPARTTTSGTAKFAASSLANVSLCVYKDQAFVKLFRAPGAAAAAPRPVPLSCFAIFAARDCLTIFASFNIPSRLAPYLDAYTAQSMRVSGLTAAQFLAPAAVQLFSTPLHLLGLDLYNRPSSTTTGAAKVSWGERWRMIRGGWLPACAARIGRIVPAFGVGGVVNYKVRQGFMTRLE